MLHAESADQPVVGDRFRRVVQVAFETLPAGVDFQALWESMRGIAGTTPTKAQLRDLSHRLAGNVPDLKARRVVAPWSFQRHYEWVPMVVARVRRSKSPSGKIGATLTLKAVAGSPCPMLVEKFWTAKQCAYMARHFGFSRPPSPNAKYPAPFPYLAPEEFATMRVWGLMDPTLSGTDPVFQKVRFPPSAVRYNRELLRRRARGADYPCPRGLPMTVRCYQCPAGYEECRAGCHPKTYVTQTCPLCKRAAPFDPDQPSPFCVNCTTKAVYTKE